MKCGIGICVSCNVGPKYVCVDGPVFSFLLASGWSCTCPPDLAGEGSSVRVVSRRPFPPPAVTELWMPRRLVRLDNTPTLLPLSAR
jgi:hypothetical protein